MSLFIIFDWTSTSFENVVRLSGSAADERLTQKVLFLAYRFSSLVDGFKSVVAYHAGDGIWVEIDILMDPEEKLVRAHDIAETLQYCLEGLKEVDRAFVTVDCEYKDCLRQATLLILQIRTLALQDTARVFSDSQHLKHG